MVAGIVVALFVLGILLGTSVQDLSERAPQYQQRLSDQIDSLLAGTGLQVGPKSNVFHLIDNQLIIQTNRTELAVRPKSNRQAPSDL